MKKLLLFSTLAFIAIASCKKPENAKSNSVTLAKYGEVTPPTVTSGILTFTSKEHYNAWMDYLDNAVKRDSTSEDTTTTAEIFDDIESSIAFNSMRKKLDNDFNALNTTGWANPNDIPQLYFIGDQTILSTLNQYGEVKIGNDIYSYLDGETIIIIKDPALLDGVRSFKNNSYTDPSQVFLVPGAIQDQNISLEYVNALQWNNGVTMLKPTGGTLNAVYGTAKPDACNGLVINLKGYMLEDLNFSVATQYSIHWGDGNITNTSGYSGIFPVTSHTYSGLGTYTIDIYGTPDPSLGYSGGTYHWQNTVTLHNSCRTDSRNNGYVWKAVPDLTMATRDYISITENSSTHRIFGSTESYHWDNSSWKAEKADRLKMYSCIEVMHSDCSTWYNHCDYTEHKKDKKITSGFNVSSEFGWNVAYGDHYILHNGDWYQHYQPLTPCP